MKKTIMIGCLCLVVLAPGWLNASETLKVAAIFPKTGDAVFGFEKYGVPEFQGTRYAVKVLNDRGGILGKQIELIELDNGSTALGSKKMAERAVEIGVIAVIGGAWSSHSLAMAPVLQKAKIPMITPSATNPEVTKARDYIFRICFIDDYQGSVMATFARKHLKAKTAAVLTNTRDIYCMGLAQYFMDEFNQQQGRIVVEKDYLQDATEFTPILKKVIALVPDVVFVPGSARDSALIIKQARTLGIKAIFLGGDAWENSMFNYGGKAIEGSYYSNHWHMNDSSKSSRQFVTDFQKDYAGDINPFIPMSYDAVMLLDNAINRANSFDRTKIRDSLAATKGFPGVTGEITFDENRNPINKSAVILKFEKEKSVYVKTIRP